MNQKKIMLCMFPLLFTLILNTGCGDTPEEQQKVADYPNQPTHSLSKQDNTPQIPADTNVIYFNDLMRNGDFTIPDTYHNALDKNPKWLQYDITTNNKSKCIRHHPLNNIRNTISFQNLPIIQHTQLQFAIGAFTGNRSSDGILFRISLQGNDGQRVVFEEMLTRFNLWEEHVVDLSPYANRTVTIHFTTEPGENANYDWATWGSPKLMMTYAEYDVKDIVSAEQHKSLITNYHDIRLSSGEHRVDRGWLAEALITDILLPKVQKDTIIHNEVYVLDRPDQKPEQLTLELLDEHNNIITSSTHKITTGQQLISDEYRVNTETILPVKVRIRLESENPSRVFIKEPVLYSRRDEQATPPQHNVILISLDTLRPDRLGCYEYSRETSPHIDALAAESFVFTNAYSNSNWTLPAHTSMFTSLYPSQHQIALRSYNTFDFYSSEWPYYYITEAFKEARYLTVAFTGNALVASQYGFNKGFDYHIENIIWSLGKKEIQMLLHSFEKNEDIPLFVFFHTYEIHEYYQERSNHHIYASSDFQRNTIPWLRDDVIRLPHIIKFLAGGSDDRGRPLFKGIFRSVTDNILPVEGIRYIHDLYDGSIWYTDTLLGELFEGLKQMGLYDNSWIILTSDHGEGLGEIHNNNQISSWHHAHRVYDDQTRIPLIIKPPQDLMQTFSSDLSIEQFVQIIDIPPTLLAILGHEPHQQFVGNDLTKFFTNSNRNPEEAVFIDDLGTGHFAVIYKEYKLIAKFIPRMYSSPNVTYELYHLTQDKAENVNLLARKRQAAKYAPIYNELKQLLETHLQGLPRCEILSKSGSAEMPDSSNELEEVDNTHLQRLKELGYL